MIRFIRSRSFGFRVEVQAWGVHPWLGRWRCYISRGKGGADARTQPIAPRESRAGRKPWKDRPAR